MADATAVLHLPVSATATAGAGRMAMEASIPEGKGNHTTARVNLFASF